MPQIVVRDQVAARKERSSQVMDWQAGMSCTARQLILERVRIELERSPADRTRLPPGCQPLVDLPKPAPLPQGEANRHAVLKTAQKHALAGFASNAFLLLVNNDQITELDYEFSIEPESDVTFVRLLPLRGG